MIARKIRRIPRIVCAHGPQSAPPAAIMPIWFLTVSAREVIVTMIMNAIGIRNILLFLPMFPSHVATAKRPIPARSWLAGLSGFLGGWIAGPMMYLEKRLGCLWAAVLYGSFCIPAAFGMGSMVQANAIAETVSYVYGIPEAAVGVIVVTLAGSVLAGGGKRIFLAAERLVPLSDGIYTAAALAVIVLYAGRIPGVFLAIMADAFSFRSAVGGIAGYGISQCVSYGIARGVFSNEAGLGSLAVLNGSAETAAEEIQGQWAIFEVFFDTIVSCTLTALVILCVAGRGAASESGAENGASLTSLCFFTALGSPGGYLVAVCVVLFAFSTIIAWYYMGRQAAEYLGGKISGRIPAIYTAGYLLAAFLGCLGAMETVWQVADIFNGLMAVPNLAALVLLVGEIDAPGEKERDTGKRETAE